MYQEFHTITVRPRRQAGATGQKRRRNDLEIADMVYRASTFGVVLIACCFILAGIIHERARLAGQEPEASLPPLPAQTISGVMEGAYTKNDGATFTTISAEIVNQEPQIITLQAETAGPELFSPEIPVSREYQRYMRTYCALYGCPYELALAVAEAESNFDMDAIGSVGEAGMMQLNPGPGGAYHAELEAATGLDPTTPEGNIAGGCYLLGKYMTEYQDMGLAAMAYNMGQTGARRAWEAGIFSTDYSWKILQGAETWKEILEG